MAVADQALVAAVGIHDPVLSIGLEGVVVKRGFVSESVLAAIPHDLLAIVAPYCVGIAGRVIVSGALDQCHRA